MELASVVSSDGLSSHFEREREYRAVSVVEPYSHPVASGITRLANASLGPAVVCYPKPMQSCGLRLTRVLVALISGISHHARSAIASFCYARVFSNRITHTVCSRNYFTWCERC